MAPSHHCCHQRRTTGCRSGTINDALHPWRDYPTQCKIHKVWYQQFKDQFLDQFLDPDSELAKKMAVSLNAQAKQSRKEIEELRHKSFNAIHARFGYKPLKTKLSNTSMLAKEDRADELDGDRE